MPNSLRLNWEDRAAVCIDRWRLKDVVWSPQVGTARVAFCSSPNGSAVLKVSTEPNMVGFETQALRHFGAEICPTVFEVANELDSMLMERIDAVSDLSSLYPDPLREVDVWIALYRRVEANRSIPAGFTTLAKYAEVFRRVISNSNTEEVNRLMARGHDRQAILMGSTGEDRLLHGDMHHFNILRDTTDNWRLIDPHGVVGHPYYELGAFLRNPWGACYEEPGVRQRLSDRVEVLADRLGLSTSTVAEYGFFGAAFSIAWSLEDGSDDIDGQVVMAQSCLELIE